MTYLPSHLKSKASCGFGLIAHERDEASTELVQTALQSLMNLSHRGAVAADGLSGDGCGLMVKTPRAFFQRVFSEIGLAVNGLFAVGQVFTNADPALSERCLAKLQQLCTDLPELHWVGVRTVPVNLKVCGEGGPKNSPCGLANRY